MKEMVVCSMANHRKKRILKQGLGELDQPEKDYLENLANSLLEIQNADFTKKSEAQESEKTPPSAQDEKKTPGSNEE